MRRFLLPLTLAALAVTCTAVATSDHPAALTAAVTAPALAFLALTLGMCHALNARSRT